VCAGKLCDRRRPEVVGALYDISDLGRHLLGVFLGQRKQGRSGVPVD
jgi:hypothetical protein